MAHAAFSASQGRIEHHFDDRMRLRAENDRLRREVYLLVEESPHQRRADGEAHGAA
jgi:hypothetical protein